MTIRGAVITLLQPRNRFPLLKVFAWEKSFCSISCNQRLPFSGYKSFTETRIDSWLKAKRIEIWSLSHRMPTSKLTSLNFYHAQELFLMPFQFHGNLFGEDLQPLQCNVSSYLKPKTNLVYVDGNDSFGSRPGVCVWALQHISTKKNCIIFLSHPVFNRWQILNFKLILLYNSLRSTAMSRLGGKKSVSGFFFASKKFPYWSKQDLR